MTTSAHKIVGSEAFERTPLMPGYGALRLGEAKSFHWGWGHLAFAFAALAVVLTAMGMNGLLP